MMEIGQQVWQDIFAWCGAAPDDEMAVNIAFERFHSFIRADREFDGLAGQWQQCHPRVGQFQIATSAQEKRQVEVPFQRLTLGWVMCKSCAAWVKLSVSAATTNTLSW